MPRHEPKRGSWKENVGNKEWSLNEHQSDDLICRQNYELWLNKQSISFHKTAILNTAQHYQNNWNYLKKDSKPSTRRFLNWNRKSSIAYIKGKNLWRTPPGNILFVQSRPQNYYRLAFYTLKTCTLNYLLCRGLRCVHRLSRDYSKVYPQTNNVQFFKYNQQSLFSLLLSISIDRAFTRHETKREGLILSSVSCTTSFPRAPSKQ